MQQYQCLLVANECYQRGRMMTPTKIVVHSTAAAITSADVLSASVLQVTCSTTLEG